MATVSVVIPTYNRAHLVGATIESALAQTYRDVEIIVVDDGSADTTREVIARYVADAGGRVQYVYQQNQGLAAARNTGCRRSRGRYIGLLDSDDLWKPEKLAVQVPILEADPTVGLVSSMAEVIDAHNNIIGIKPKSPPGTTLREMITKGTQPPSSFLIRREAIEAIGYFDPEIKRGIEDVDFCFRLARRWKFVCLNQVLIQYRSHDTNLSSEPIGTYQGYVRTYEKLLATADGTDIPRPAARRFLAKYLYLLATAEAKRGQPEAARQRVARALRLWPFVGWSIDEQQPWWGCLMNVTKSYGVAAKFWLAPSTAPSNSRSVAGAKP